MTTRNTTTMAVVNCIVVKNLTNPESGASSAQLGQGVLGDIVHRTVILDLSEYLRQPCSTP